MHFHIHDLLKRLHEKKFGRTPRKLGEIRSPTNNSSSSNNNNNNNNNSSNSNSINSNLGEDGIILEWSNKLASQTPQDASSNPSPLTQSFVPMQAFNDPMLSDSLYFLQLLWAYEPMSIDWKLVYIGEGMVGARGSGYLDGKLKGSSAITQEQKLMNSRYAISVARKLGALIFVCAEDLVEVKPKMVLSFVAAILELDKRFDNS